MGGFSLGSKNGVTWGEVKDWIHLRFSSPRNTLRFSFNIIQNVGEGMEMLGFGFSKFTGGGSAALLSTSGFLVNSTGAVGNSVIDLYDGRGGSAFLSLGKHFAFAGLTKTASTLTGGNSDEFALEIIMLFYNKYVLPNVGQNYINDNPNSIFERIEYKRY